MRAWSGARSAAAKKARAELRAEAGQLRASLRQHERARRERLLLWLRPFVATKMGSLRGEPVGSKSVHSDNV